MIDPYTLEKKSIKEALSGNWHLAILTNLEILKDNPDDLGALNRLAKAQSETGLLDEAKDNLKKILKIDPFNSVAKSNLVKINFNQKYPSSKPKSKITGTINFIEEAGKTKVVSLVNPGDPIVLSHVSIGQEVFIKTVGRKVKVMDESKHYLGSLPDDLSLYLGNFIKQGNKYQFLVRSATPHQLEVFIRETKQSARLRGMASFPETKTNFPNSFNSAKLNETPLEMFDPSFSEGEE